MKGKADMSKPEMLRLLEWIDAKASQAIRLQCHYEAYGGRTKAERQGDMAEAFMVVCDYIAREFGYRLPYCGRRTAWHETKQRDCEERVGLRGNIE